MIKIKSIKFKAHPILGNLHLDFCDKNGNPADTIIIAGENGTGKTTVLEEVHKIMSDKCDNKDLELEVLYNNNLHSIIYSGDLVHLMTYSHIGKIKHNGKPRYSSDEQFKQETGFSSIYSTVNINFTMKEITSITAKELDRQDIKNIKSDTNMAMDIAQLIVDIRADDSERINQALENNQDPKTVEKKLDRFINAFKFMFDDKLKFKTVTNKNDKKIFYLIKTITIFLLTI